MQYADLAPGHRISRVIKGGWQLAGGHGAIDRAEGLEDMVAFADAGIVTFDCADIYTGVEEMIGAFRAQYLKLRGAEAFARVKVHTKYVPDLGDLSTLTRADVARAIDRSRQRLGVERLDLVQFHWWDHAVDRSTEVALWLAELRREGRIANVGGTNFDAARTREMVRAGVPLASMQVQYSLIDDRPSRALAQVAAETGMSLLCYGTVAGGLFSERWLGAPEPEAPFENRSLPKYKLIVDEWGGWALFQELLAVLDQVARRLGSDVASVASRLVLDRPGVAAVIVGARSRAHLERNLAIPDLDVGEAERTEIAAVLAHGRSVPGEVYELERDRTGRHGRIMKYELNRVEG
ncbi:hypothetical protein Rumeso_02453 [Rubellimicrobium mesophilum DSM 19309]|uniref:NADP-dependent oxidoreductase domain-containing protein n=1 Tax=Rubellimicrobium mesophilum DSM 19309 TaxID=442562 RepID=A0A017HQK0_9RHOB|nr:aldo/keto reductase [Rubellimicrobium mesophilum]EYD76024.1 hypothetical protein Rumeso_02453 [Rubellimicrobium mesophilum DSM 19309]